MAVRTDGADTKAAWRRRALQAERRLRELQSLVDTLHAADVRMIYRIADAQVVIDELRGVLEWYDQASASES